MEFRRFPAAPAQVDNPRALSEASAPCAGPSLSSACETRALSGGRVSRPMGSRGTQEKYGSLSQGIPFRWHLKGNLKGNHPFCEATTYCEKPRVSACYLMLVVRWCSLLDLDVCWISYVYMVMLVKCFFFLDVIGCYVNVALC